MDGKYSPSEEFFIILKVNYGGVESDKWSSSCWDGGEG